MNQLEKVQVCKPQGPLQEPHDVASQPANILVPDTCKPITSNSEMKKNFIRIYQPRLIFEHSLLFEGYNLELIEGIEKFCRYFDV